MHCKKFLFESVETKLKTKTSDKIGSFGFAEILDRIDNPKKYENKPKVEEGKTEEKESKKEKLKSRLKSATNSNILKAGALLIAAKAMKEEEDEESDENPFAEDDDEGDESEGESEEIEDDEEEEPEEEEEEEEDFDDENDENNLSRPMDGKIRKDGRPFQRSFQNQRSDSNKQKHEADAAGADAAMDSDHIPSEDEEWAFKNKESIKVLDNGAERFEPLKIGLCGGIMMPKSLWPNLILPVMEMEYSKKYLKSLSTPKSFTKIRFLEITQRHFWTIEYFLTFKHVYTVNYTNEFLEIEVVDVTIDET